MSFSAPQAPNANNAASTQAGYNEMAPLFAAAIQALKADNDNVRAELAKLKAGQK